MASNAKSRQPRLRASCDGCFLAKVKCSKARPICSRCLACGIVCHYSPSSRAGKPKLDHSLSSHQNGHSDLQQQMQSLIDETSSPYATLPQAPPDQMFPCETGWTTPPASVEGSMSRNPSISHGLPLLSMDETTLHEQEPMSAPPEIYSATMPWTPPTDVACTVFPEVPVTVAHMQVPHVRSQSFDTAMSMPMPWNDPLPHDMISYSHLQTPTMPSNYFPSPTATPTMRSITSHQKGTATSSCACFTSCLQSLQALHNASSPNLPPFDLVLSLNRRAVEGCAAMLGCNVCFSRSGAHTATMLLATIIGKVTSFYKAATHSYFEAGNVKAMESDAMSGSGSLGVSFGAYQLNGEDGQWFQLEILAREMRKLEEVYVKFRDVCNDASDDPEVTQVVIGHLGYDLGSTLEVISQRKEDGKFMA
ncbi:hypothetical protein GGR57DRAFT_162555 [Xylariaceae sp. FL1272]|nr:hypothetical protein GGR57DRAFT_162555 [Xylariaceae sp. FL1272]